jgi:hypothetical protein
VRRPLARCLIRFFLLSGVYAVDGLLHKRPVLTNAAINLLGQDFKALVAENDRLALSRFGNRRHDSQMISSVQGDGLSDHPHIVIEATKLGVHIVEPLAQKSFDRWSGVQKMLEGGFNQHALADARSVGCDVKPTTDAFTQPNRHFATRGGFALARRSNVNAIDLRIQFGELLHFLIFPQNPMIDTAATRYD